MRHGSPPAARRGVSRGGGGDHLRDRHGNAFSDEDGHSSRERERGGGLSWLLSSNAVRLVALWTLLLTLYVLYNNKSTPSLSDSLPIRTLHDREAVDGDGDARFEWDDVLRRQEGNGTGEGDEGGEQDTPPHVSQAETENSGSHNINENDRERRDKEREERQARMEYQKAMNKFAEEVDEQKRRAMAAEQQAEIEKNRAAELREEAELLSARLREYEQKEMDMRHQHDAEIEKAETEAQKRLEKSMKELQKSSSLLLQSERTTQKRRLLLEEEVCHTMDAKRLH